MKIYILPINNCLQPNSQAFRYPAHNLDYGIEQDFLKYLLKKPELTTTNPEKADWHYLPVYWTRWHLNHDFAQTGLDKLYQFVNQAILDNSKTFTVCQYDGGAQIELGKSISFLAAPTEESNYYAPILCTPHRTPIFKLSKKYLACFNGAFNTHLIRKEMLNRLQTRTDLILGGHVGTPFMRRFFLGKRFVTNMIESYVALCPRGTSANSFRFFEAMQLGVVPCLISDIDVRPFHKYIDWDEVSFFVKTIDELESLLNSLDHKNVLQMGRKAHQCWKENIQYQQWCKHLIHELGDIINK